MYEPSRVHWTEQIPSLGPKSHNFVTWEQKEQVTPKIHIAILPI